MKYKAGDKVIMKKRSNYVPDMALYFKDHSDMILTIKEVKDNEYVGKYIMRGFSYHWDDNDIECKIEKPFTPIDSRFDILDIR